MGNLTERQKNLLVSIIKEFIETAEAVGSISLQNKYNLKFSTATIRNEMADLVELGYLYQKHLSGGRIPTTKGWRYFVDDLDYNQNYLNLNRNNELEKISHTIEKRDSIRQSIAFLSSITNNASIALIEKDLYYAGLSEIVNIPEFRDTNNLRKMLSILEDYYTLSEILNKGNPDEDINILIGEETDSEIFHEYSIVFTEIRVNGYKKGYIAVIGPTRMHYDRVIAGVNHVSKIVRDLLN
jgi:heat-inducible transcriptional repressor